MGPDGYLQHLTFESARLADAGRAALSSPVPSCPGWSVADLLRHTGRVYRWAATMLRERSPERISTRGMAMPEDEDAPDWFEDGASELLAALKGIDPDTSVWFLTGEPAPARRWHRRMAHETSIHRWDAQNAADRDPTPVDAELAADGVDEFLGLHLRLRDRDGVLAEHDARIALACTDVPGRWVLTPRDEAGPQVLASPDAPADATLSGPASDLVLALWGRTDLDRLALDGDTTAARDWWSRLRRLEL